MNPGLVTHCIKKAISDLGQRLGSSGPSLENGVVKSLARELGVCRIDITEVDTQEADFEPSWNDFSATWSCISFFEEVAKAESVYHSKGPVRTGRFPMSNLECSMVMGKDLQEFQGYIVPHEEVHTTPQLFDLDDLEVRFVYCPSEQMKKCLEASSHLSMESFPAARNFHIIESDAASDAYNSVGALVRTRDGKGQWCGLKCTSSDAWAKTSGQGNATSWLTAWGVLLSIQFCIDSPSKGACLPEDLPSEWFISRISEHLLSAPADKLAPEVT